MPKEHKGGNYMKSFNISLKSITDVKDLSI